MSDCLQTHNWIAIKWNTFVATTWMKWFDDGGGGLAHGAFIVYFHFLSPEPVDYREFILLSEK